jgi:hypothetical protein
VDIRSEVCGIVVAFILKKYNVSKGITILKFTDLVKSTISSVSEQLATAENERRKPNLLCSHVKKNRYAKADSKL